MADDSLITEEARAMIGQPLGDPVCGQVLRKEVERYAHAVGDENPLYFDPAYARAAGYRDTIVPPMFVEIFRRSAEPLTALREDGLSKSRQSPIPLRVNRVMAGGEEVEYLHPIYPGDTITGVTRLVDLIEKIGRSGPFVIIKRETIYTNQDGVIVMKNRNSSVVL